MSEPLASIRHLRQAKLCSGGARAWFKEHGLSWDEFVSPGIPVTLLEATGDAFALQVAAKARAEADRG